MQKTVIASRSATVGIAPSNAPGGRTTESASVRISAQGPRTSRIDAGWDTIVDVEPPPSPGPVPACIVVKNPRTSLIDAEWDASGDSEPAPSAVRHCKISDPARTTTAHASAAVEKTRVEPTRAPIPEKTKVEPTHTPIPKKTKVEPTRAPTTEAMDVEIELEPIPAAMEVELEPAPTTDATRATTPRLARVKPSRHKGERILLFLSGFVVGVGLLLGWSVANVAGYSGEALRSLGYRNTAVDARAVHAALPPTVTPRDRVRPTPTRPSESNLDRASLDRTAATQPVESAEPTVVKPATKALNPTESTTPAARSGKSARIAVPTASHVRRTIPRRRTSVADDNPY